MVRNHNGYWMSPKFFGMSPTAEDAGDVGGIGGGTGAPAGDGADGGNDSAGDDQKKAGGADNDLASQIEQLKADLARQKAALDKATHEASDYKKSMNEAKNQLKAKMTQEEIDAANKKEAEEKTAQELEELRRKVAKAENTKSVMSKLSVDEDTAGKIAESMVGCENIENALLLIQKSWDAKEQALRIEFGKLPGPGQGGSSEEDAEERAAIELAKRLGKDRAAANQSVAEGLKGYIR